MPRFLRRQFSITATCRYIFTKSRFVQAAAIATPEQQFNKNEPVIFKKRFRDLPAIAKWFSPSTVDDRYHELNLPYLEHHGNISVPFELRAQDGSFHRSEGPLSFLLDHMTSVDTPVSLYLAQCPLEDLSHDLRADLPTPNLLYHLGRGDIYASSLWMGRPPTKTPLHRDPNPNLFVQLAGRKVLRLMKPELGRRLYERSRVAGHANMRGEEMMAGPEMEKLEQAIWDDDDNEDGESGSGVEATLESGDALYIPLGWWHAVHGVGQGANASVNWWFR